MRTSTVPDRLSSGSACIFWSGPTAITSKCGGNPLVLAFLDWCNFSFFYLVFNDSRSRRAGKCGIHNAGDLHYAECEHGGGLFSGDIKGYGRRIQLIRIISYPAVYGICRDDIYYFLMGMGCIFIALLFQCGIVIQI